MGLFKVVVEFFRCEDSETHERSFLNEKEPDQNILIGLLSRTKGIYAFYNSEFEVIYVGKTKNNLWEEMKTSYNKKMPHYKLYYVHHPRERYKATSSGVARKIQSRTPYVWETAIYFSAYSVEEGHIDDLERFIIRIMPNDVSNKRMEGNNSLEMHVTIEEP